MILSCSLFSVGINSAPLESRKPIQHQVERMLCSSSALSGQPRQTFGAADHLLNDLVSCTVEAAVGDADKGGVVAQRGKNHSTVVVGSSADPIRSRAGDWVRTL